MAPLCTIDNGNGPAKAALFAGEKLTGLWNLRTLLAREDLRNYPIALASVGKERELAPLAKHRQVSRVGDFRRPGEFLGMPVNYGPTLGEDRLVTSWHLHGQGGPFPTILIDTGTFITVDTISESGLHGGPIFPGLGLFLSCYGHSDRLDRLQTGDLPDLAALGDSLPKTTRQAIHAAVKTFIRAIVPKARAARMVLTGGDAKLFAPFLPGDTELSPRLIHQALRRFHSTLSSRPAATKA